MRKSTICFMSALFCFGLQLMSTVALSDTDAADKKADAKQHFENGKALYAEENYRGAAAEFEASVAAYPTKSGYFNLANCHKALHRYATALAAVEALRKRFVADLESDGELAAKVDEIERSIRDRVGLLSVTSTPAGAEISVDGKPVGTTPLSRALLLGPGEHIVVAKLRGYVAVEKSVSVLSKSEVQLAFRLEPEQARITVTVSVPDAEVQLDGVLVGRSPLQESISVAPGQHAVDVTLAGFLPDHREFSLSAGEEVLLDVTLVSKSALNGRNPAVSTRALKTLAWVGLGSAVLLGGTSGVLFYFREQAIDEYNKEGQLYSDENEQLVANKHKMRMDQAGSRAQLLHGFAIATTITAGVCAIGALTMGILAASRKKNTSKSKAQMQVGPLSVGVRF